MSPRIERNSSQFRTQNISNVSGNPVDFMKTAVPADVSTATALKHPAAAGNFDDQAVAFRMRDPKSGKAIDMVWDRKADALYMLQEGKMVQAPDALKGATLDRLLSDDKGASLRATRKDSLYDQMQRDMIEFKGKSTSQTTQTPNTKEPPLPTQKDEEPFDAKKFYAELNDAADGARKNQLDVEERAVGAVPTADYLAVKQAGDEMLKELDGHVTKLNGQIAEIDKRITALEKSPKLTDAERLELDTLQSNRGIAQATRGVLNDRAAQIRDGVKALSGGQLTADELSALSLQDWNNDWNVQQISKEAQDLSTKRSAVDRTKILQ